MAQPLSKTKKDGTRYQRPLEIDAAIDRALGENLDVLRRRAAIRDAKSPDHLPTECLVHLVRRTHRDGDGPTRDCLLRALLSRCEAILNNKVVATIPNAEEVRREILSDFAMLFAIDGSPEDKLELDIFEVRFNLGFESFRITRLRPIRGGGAILHVVGRRSPYSSHRPGGWSRLNTCWSTFGGLSIGRIYGKRWEGIGNDLGPAWVCGFGRRETLAFFLPKISIIVGETPPPD